MANSFQPLRVSEMNMFQLEFFINILIKQVFTNGFLILIFTYVFVKGNA